MKIVEYAILISYIPEISELSRKSENCESDIGILILKP